MGGTHAPMFQKRMMDMSVGELKGMLENRGVRYSHCVEKSELVELLMGGDKVAARPACW